MTTRLCAKSVWVGVAVLVLALPAAAFEDTGAIDRARSLSTAGLSQYKQGDYQAAIRSFEEAASLRPSPLLDYNIGRCHDQLGQHKAAAARYERYLSARPDAPNAQQVRRRLDEIRSALVVPPDPGPLEDSTVAVDAPPPPVPISKTQRPPPQAPTAPPGRAGPTPIYRKWWFWVAIAAGATIVTFVIVTAATSGDRSSTEGSNRTPLSMRSPLQITF